ncbi:MAG: polysaccharide biosynthesis protein PslG [Actinomycetota bacterium]|nr:polysaccharide biosynthesis protein PslG [Actinomycetota bacterium]
MIPEAKPRLVPSAAGGLRIGISYGDTLAGLSPAQLARTLDDAVTLGVGWIRVDLSWADVQGRSPSSDEWGAFDRIATAAQERNLDVLAILAYAPAWARPTGCSSEKCAPADPGSFAAFASDAVRRYAPLGVRTWEVWNEPNLTGFWKPQPSVPDYLRLLKATVPAIRAVDPGATVIAGSLAAGRMVNGDVTPFDYLNALGAAGGLGLVDAVGYHPYSFPLPPLDTQAPNAWAGIATTQPSLHGVLSAQGFGDMKIWVTECGAPTGGPGDRSTTLDYTRNPAPDHVSEDLQALMAMGSLRFAKTSTAVGGLFWYSYKDLGTNRSDRENFFGLRRFDDSPKPSYWSFKQAVAASR